MEHRQDLTGTRSILSNLEEYRIAVAEIATRANRTLSIYTTDLEPLIYDHDLFLEPVKRLARRLTSYIDLRNVAPEYRDNPCSFIVADDKAIAFRQQASTWDGIVEFNDASVVKRYLAYFDEVWAGSLVQPEMRATAVDC